MNLLQNILLTMEVGGGRAVVRLIPIVVSVALVCFVYDYLYFNGLREPESMDNAQVARQIYSGQGLTTKFLRPYAVAQLRAYAASQHSDLFPAARFPANVPRVLPDTYNAPGFPYLLAGWFHVVHPQFGEPIGAIVAAHAYAPDRWIPILNQIFVLLTAVLVFILGFRVFDERVAWISLIAFLCTEMIWRFSITGLSTSFLTLLVTAILYCALEIVRIGEQCFKSEASSFATAWLWAVALGLLLAIGSVTRFNLVVLLAPLFVLFMVMPRANIGIPLLITVMVLGTMAPWFYHLYKVSGNALGSTEPLILLGQGDYADNEIYCTTGIPSYELFFRNATTKEYLGFAYHLEHFWSLLGSNVMVLFFAASILHRFKRRRIWLFHWFLFGCALVLVLSNNLGVVSPNPIDAWNIVPVLLPCMVVMGTAFFFLLLDRLDIEIRLLTNLIIIVAVLLSSTPLIMSVTGVDPPPSSFPPYLPPLIKIVASYTQPDEWITSDMPWATAWYGDRASLWLPDSITDFENMHDTLAPTGILLFTPQSWLKPIDLYRRGEYKDWAGLVFGNQPPPDFPLSAHTLSSTVTDYSIWSDRARWQQQ